MKKSILFVDDDPFLLRAYGMLLNNAQSKWEVRTASGPRPALALLEQQHFDVVVSDMRMPDMTGAELAVEIRKRYPATSRIIISGFNEKEEVVRCLGTVHQFLPKPFDRKSLQDTLARISSLDAFLSDENLKVLVTQLGELPSFPSLYLEITRELAGQVPSVERVAEIVGQDPAMTAKLLQLVNSAVLGLTRRISSLFEAVQFLGIGTVRALALSMHVFADFERVGASCLSIGHLWEHSLRTGILARALMQREQASPADAEDAYVAGMLHDIGKLMLADGLPEAFQRAYHFARERDLHLDEAELEVFGATHAAVGAYLLGLWGLPAPIVEAVAFHHQPAKSDLQVFSPLTATHVANVLEQELFEPSNCGPRPCLDTDYLTAIGVERRLKTWREESQKLRRAQGSETQRMEHGA